MNFDTVHYGKIDETVHVYRHPSGLKAFVIPKKGYSKKYATFATHYGSINNAFIAPGDSEITVVPDGIAHFLEHKLFDQEYGNVMDEFSKLGSNPNAYTSFNQTVYLFSCTDMFEDNFKLLLDFVQSPYITEESVERERGIIEQEIRMYEDEPGWRSFFNLLKAFYEKNPVNIEITGTVESIRKITRGNLYKCYDTFYHPSNMVVLVVGDVEPEKVFRQVEEGIKMTYGKPGIKRIFPEEIAGINKNYVELGMAVSAPLFQMGFRDDRIEKGIENLKHEIAVKLLLEMIMGRSSGLYNEMYSEGLINNTFEFDFTIEENYAFSMFGGESPDPHKVREKIAEEVKNIRKNGLDKNGYERIKKAMKGRFLKRLNSVEKISSLFISAYFKNVEMFDYFDVYDKITFEYVKDMFDEHFNLDNLALSTINPV